MIDTLSETSGGFHHDASILDVEFVAVEIEELLQKLAITELVAFEICLGHMLQHARDQTDDGEATDPTQEHFIEASHDKKLFDDHYENGHMAEAFLPCAEGRQSLETGIILERDVHFDAGLGIDKFENWDLCFRDDSHHVVFGNIVSFQERRQLEPKIIRVSLC